MSDSLGFVLVSGLSFPFRSRKWIIDLSAEVMEREGGAFMVIAGHILAGKELEAELKPRIKEALVGVPSKDKARVKEETEAGFVEEMANSLNEFLPKLPNGANYHIVIAEKIYDRPIGRQILERVARMRTDVRLSDDPETKIPINLPGFGDMRVIVPRKTPWFYENISGLMQRLVNAFVRKTNSPRPSLIVAGCTGSGGFIPCYKGVPVIAIPASHIIDEQLSTENMAGCVFVRIEKNGSGYRVVPKFYDWRTAIFKEKELSIPESLNRDHKMILSALKPGSASMSTIRFRVNQIARKPWSLKKIERRVKELLSNNNKLIVFKKTGNRYDLNSSLLKKVRITLDEFLADSHDVKLVIKSCWHVGALKTLYFTVLDNESKLIRDADADISNGDTIQGLSHNYEYNGELLPPLNGPDKHENAAAQMQAKILLDGFKKRWKEFHKQVKDLKELLDLCLVPYIYNVGNHDEPRFSRSKNAIGLFHFDVALRHYLLEGIMKFLEKQNVSVKPTDVIELIEHKIVRVGESRVVVVNGLPIGVKHPHQARTKSKSQRIQETGDFFAEAIIDWPQRILKHVSAVAVANFHEAAAVFTSVFGRTIFGVMTGAQVKDTQFENNKNKVVDHGLAKAIIRVNKEGKILAAEVVYYDDIHEDDAKIVFADKLTNRMIAEHSLKLSQEFDMPWR